jgi:hypothetical protein
MSLKEIKTCKWCYQAYKIVHFIDQEDEKYE